MKSILAVALFLISFAGLAQYTAAPLDSLSRKESRSYLLEQSLSTDAQVHAFKHQKYRNTGNNILIFSGVLMATAATLQATINFENMSPYEFMFVQFGLIGGTYVASATGFLIGGIYHLLSAVQLTKAKNAYLKVYPALGNNSTGLGLSISF